MAQDERVVRTSVLGRIAGALMLVGLVGGAMNCSSAEPNERAGNVARATCDASGEVAVKTLSWALGSDTLEAKTTASPETGAVIHALTANFAGKTVFKTESTVAPDRSVHTVAHYYKPLSSVDVDLVFDVKDGIVRGTLGGKALAPIDMESAKKNPSAVAPRYLDGTTIAPVTTPANDSRLAALIGQMSKGTKAATCDPSGPDLALMSEPGHVSSPGTGDECRNCKRLCALQYAGCLFIGSVGCLGCFGLVSIHDCRSGARGSLLRVVRVCSVSDVFRLVFVMQHGLQWRVLPGPVRVSLLQRGRELPQHHRGHVLLRWVGALPRPDAELHGSCDRELSPERA